MEHPKTIVLTATLRGTRWKFKDASNIPKDALEEGPLDGLCDYDKKTLYVPMEPKGLEDLDTIIHEVVHAILPDLSEECVRESSSAIARILHRFGYRSLQDRL
jgi:hypothetical protein